MAIGVSPEEKARLVIDEKLEASGYAVQDVKEFNPTARIGVAVREWQTESGPCDYLIFIDGIPCGLIEAKEHDKGVKLTSVAEQTKRYAESKIKYASPNVDIRFAYEATDVLVRFCDYHDKDYRSRQVYSFHRPEQLRTWLKASDTLRNRLRSFPELNTSGFRRCQINAIVNLESSFSQNRPRALIQMATGAGKTYTAITNVYRLLKFAGAKRILFLVDTKNLGEQAEEEFRKYKPSDDARLFPELYNVCRLNSPQIPNDANVCISTIQRMYSILKGRELDESAEETSLNEQRITGGPRDVEYNPSYPPEYFDFIIIDECHRSIYNVWQQVLDYFDAFLIGLTATPDKRTFSFFNQNVVSEYTHEEAVIDGVNVDGDAYIIETDVGSNGATITEPLIEKRDRLSRAIRWEQNDEVAIEYDSSKLDRDVVNPSQIRTVVREFRDRVTTVMFPGRTEIPKTLIFAKTDSHADDIINIVREEFGKGNEFCKKITYNSSEDPKSVLASFRNEFNPRIAVTVDMIATGTDVKALECLVFMRDVRSKNYYEQMLGRGRRTLGHDDLARVSPSARTNKSRYVVVDCVGVTKSLKTETRALDRKPSVSLKDLMMSVVTGARDDDTVTSLASKILRLAAIMDSREHKRAAELADGKHLNDIARDMLDAFDEDKIAEYAGVSLGAVEGDLGAETIGKLQQAQAELVEEAVKPFFSPDLRNYLENVRKSHDQIIDNENLDSITSSGWDIDREDNARKTVETFREFLESNRDELDALQIIYGQTYKQRRITLGMVKAVHEALKASPYGLSCDRLWHAYEVLGAPTATARSTVGKLMDIISVIRFELGQEKILRPFETGVAERFKSWVFSKNAGHGQFTEEQMEWLRMLRDHIATSGSIGSEDLDYSPFGEKGGLGQFYRLFGGQYQELLDEINYALVA